MTADNSGGAKSGKKWQKKTRRESFVWARVSPEERELVEKLANMMGFSTAEFIRYLIMQELDRRSFLTMKLEKAKKEMQKRPEE
ncbi:MAG: hypothetical protein ACP5IT_10070 [Thermoproteota archaeon]|jgi:uncharacterized protein (DUF1778 family)